MARSPSPGGATIRVLVCDDFEAIRELLRVVIELDAGLSLVGEACNGDEAIARARELQPDVVLLDLSMPVRTGLGALPDILIAAPATAVIAYTGLPEDVVGDAAVEAGATCVLQKGADPAAIIEAIKETHRANRRADPRADAPRGPVGVFPPWAERSAREPAA